MAMNKCVACGMDSGKRLACKVCRKKVMLLEGTDRTRELVRIRDNHTCQSCKKVWNSKVWNKKSRRFDVHHLNGLCGKKSKRYDKMKDIPNLITLCHSCHFNHPDHSQVKSRNSLSTGGL